MEKKVLLAILKPSWPWAQVGVEDLGFRALGRGRALVREREVTVREWEGEGVTWERERVREWTVSERESEIFNGCGAPRIKITWTRNSMSGVSGPTAGVSGVLQIGGRTWWRAWWARSHRWYVQVAKQAASNLPPPVPTTGCEAWLFDAPYRVRVLRGTQTSQATLVVSCRLGRLLGDTPYEAEEKNLRVTVLYDYAENKYAAHVPAHLCR